MRQLLRLALLLGCLAGFVPGAARAQIGGSGSGGSGDIAGGAGRTGKARGHTAADGDPTPAPGTVAGAAAGPGTPYSISPTIPELQNPGPSLGNTTGTDAGVHR